MLRKIFLLLLVIQFLICNLQSVISPLSAQNKAIDSLLMLLEKDKEDTSRIAHLIYLSWEYSETGSYDNALHYGQLAGQLAQKIGNKRGLGASYNSIGIIYYYLGNYDKALENYYASLKIRETIGDKKGIASLYNNFGLIYMDQGNYDKALENYFAFLKTAEEIGDKKGVAGSYNNIGMIYNKQGNNDKALENHLASLKIRKETGDKYGIASSYGNIGNIYTAQENYDKALENYFISLKTYEEIDSKNDVANSYNNIGIAYGKKNNYSEAITYLQKGLRLSMEIGAKNWTRDAYKGLSETYSSMDDYKNAYKNYQLYSAAKDTLFNGENSKVLAEMQTKYETEKKQKQIELLEQQTQIHELRNNRNLYIIFGMLVVLILFGVISGLFLRQNKLKARQKEVELEQQLLRSQMNPHFIYNALNSIQNFIFKNDQKQSAKYLAGFARLMRLVLENSREKSISLEKEIATLENYLQLQQLRFKNSFEYSLNADPAIDPEETFIPPMLIQPFVENAIEHGLKEKTEGGRIEINFSSENGHLKTEIIDNGIGIQKSKESVQKNVSNHTSLATTITNERISAFNKKNRQKISLKILDLGVEGKERSGTHITIFMPLKNTAVSTI